MLASTILLTLATSFGDPVAIGTVSAPPLRPGAAVHGGVDRASTVGPADELGVLWRGSRIPMTEVEAQLRAELPNEWAGSKRGAAAVGEQLARYANWILDAEYSVGLSKDARVVLVTRSAKLGKRRMKVVESTLAAFDEILSPPDRTGSKERFRRAQWGQGDHEPDTSPVMLFEIESRADYASLVEAAGAVDPALSSWATAKAEHPGFAEGRLSAAAWQAAPSGFEIGKVWRSENELVNRLSRLLLYRSFGPQPVWFSLGTAWLLEQEVLGDIYAFPYRYEFVGVGEHKGWKSELRSLFKRRKDAPLRMEEFAEWRRNTWDDQQAAIAWGMCTFLRQRGPGHLGAFAEASRLRYKETYRETRPGGSWVTRPDYQLSSDDQLELLIAETGENVLSQASGFFTSWKIPRVRR